MITNTDREWCKHFTGILSKRCALGVAYETVRDTSTVPYGLPCVQSPGTAGRCALAVYPTPEEVATREAEIDALLNQFSADLAANICPHCKTPIQRQRQNGRCVYAVPCGCRLYQGKATP